MNNFYFPYSRPVYSPLGFGLRNVFPWWITTLIIILIIWDLVWKGYALWKAAQNKQKYWFIALMIINSLGILPIIYISFFSKKSSRRQAKT